MCPCLAAPSYAFLLIAFLLIVCHGVCAWCATRYTSSGGASGVGLVAANSAAQTTVPALQWATGTGAPAMSIVLGPVVDIVFELSHTPASTGVAYDVQAIATFPGLVVDMSSALCLQGCGGGGSPISNSTSDSLTVTLPSLAQAAVLRVSVRALFAASVLSGDTITGTFSAQYDTAANDSPDKYTGKVTSLPNALAARQSQNINQNGATSGFEMYFAPGTFGAGSQRSQPKHVSNPDSVIKKFKPPFIYDSYLFRPLTTRCRSSSWTPRRRHAQAARLTRARWSTVSISCLAFASSSRRDGRHSSSSWTPGPRRVWRSCLSAPSAARA